MKISLGVDLLLSVDSQNIPPLPRCDTHSEDGLQGLKEVRLRSERTLLPGLEASLRELRARAKWLWIYIDVYMFALTRGDYPRESCEDRLLN